MTKIVISAISAIVISTYVIKKSLTWKTSKLNFNIFCSCKKVKLNISSPSGLRVSCSCENCKSFVRKLLKKRETQLKITDETENFFLSENEETDEVQIYKSDIKIEKGKEYLKHSTLTKDTILLRAFSTCCFTPLYNTGKRETFFGPFLGLILIKKNFENEQDYNQLTDIQFRLSGDNTKFTTHMRYLLAFLFRNVFCFNKSLLNQNFDLDLDDFNVIDNINLHIIE
ncbi:hypothetical protein HDU92_004758 [Lobulomyces angularis]|nr:hypothetical protein HDU92_004758 [Lobulomyces angularis]